MSYTSRSERSRPGGDAGAPRRPPHNPTSVRAPHQRTLRGTWLPFSVSVLFLLVSLTSCELQTEKRRLTHPAEASSLDRASPFLKAHTRDGNVYVLRTWEVRADAGMVLGTGELLDINRQVVRTGKFTVPLDSVALFETNVVHTSPSVAAMALVTGASAALTAYCLSNPKACFGSCPTFYVTDGDRPRLQAEGFSASVAPRLEATDIDALYRAHPRKRAFEVRLTNEALETHVLRSVRLLVARRPQGGRVFATSDGGFWQSEHVIGPTAAFGPEGDCLAALQSFDGVERVSLTDSTDLAAKEVLDLEFSIKQSGTYGLVIASRQSLLSTYLFYQSLAYMGRSAGSWIAALERGDRKVLERSGSIARLLGGIEVLAPEGEGLWRSIGETNETGPLATDVRIACQTHFEVGIQRLRLRLTRGHWRLDYVALARLDQQVAPLRLDPFEVRRGEVVDDRAKGSLRDSASVLVTFPGDEYTLLYELPQEFDALELFLESRGYYLEWMRREWLLEENMMRAAMMFLNPQEALRALAPEFKKSEADMENAFWNSRYVDR